MAALCLLVSCTNTVQPVTGTPQVGSSSWRVEVGRGVAGLPDRVVLVYQPYLSAPVSNEIHFVAVCTSCDGDMPPLLGRLLLTPEFCGSSSTRPAGQICWSAPVTFPRAGVWHFTSPYDADIRIQ
jgi:hypothetical protein